MLSLLRQNGRVYVGTGMDGQLFEVDEATREKTEIARLDHGQIHRLLRRKDGSVFTAYVKDSPILDDAGRLIGIVGCSIEISDPDLAQAVRSLISDNHHGPQRRTRTLSPRERECLVLAFQGLTARESAQQLHCTERTVNYHIANAMSKLKVDNKMAAIQRACWLGAI